LYVTAPSALGLQTAGGASGASETERQRVINVGTAGQSLILAALRGAA